MVAFIISVFCLSSLFLLMALDRPDVGVVEKVIYCALYFVVNILLLGGTHG